MKATIIAALVVALAVTSGAGAAFVVTSKNIRNGTIQLVDINPRTKAALRGRRGPQGPPGVPGISSITEATATLTILPSGRGNAVATCPAGLAPISGGYLSAGSIVGSVVVEVSRRSQGRGWEVGASGPSGLSMLVYVYCAPGVT
jgi:hypothetical protein